MSLIVKLLSFWGNDIGLSRSNRSWGNRLWGDELSLEQFHLVLLVLEEFSSQGLMAFSVDASGGLIRTKGWALAQPARKMACKKIQSDLPSRGAQKNTTPPVLISVLILFPNSLGSLIGRYLFRAIHVVMYRHYIYMYICIY